MIDGKQMSDGEAVKAVTQGFELLLSQSAIIAMLPVEEWLEQMERAESIAPILDPTLYRDYIYSPKAQIIKDVIRAAIPLKAAVLKAQAIARKEMMAGG